MTRTADNVELISNSEIQTFKRCRRKWWLQWHRRLVPVALDTPVGPRAIGIRGHRALQLYYDPAARRPLLEALEDEIALDRLAMTEQDWPEEVRERFTAEADLERIVLTGYLDWLAETGADAGLEPVAAEAYLEVPLDVVDGVAIYVVGKLDLRVRRDTDGAIRFMDHKFKAQLPNAGLLPMDEQLKTYQLLQQEQQADVVADGAIYNVLRTVKRSGRARPPFYERTEIRHGPIEMRNFSDRLRAEIVEILDLTDLLRRGFLQWAYPSPSAQCSWDCPFVRICPMFDDGSRVEDALATLYRPGDPLAHYRDDRGADDAA